MNVFRLVMGTVLFEVGGLVNSDRTEIQITGQFVPLGNGVEIFVL